MVLESLAVSRVRCVTACGFLHGDSSMLLAWIPKRGHQRQHGFLFVCFYGARKKRAVKLSAFPPHVSLRYAFGYGVRIFLDKDKGKIADGEEKKGFSKVTCCPTFAGPRLVRVSIFEQVSTDTCRSTRVGLLCGAKRRLAEQKKSAMQPLVNSTFYKKR